MEKLLKNEKDNLGLVFQKVSTLIVMFFTGMWSRGVGVIKKISKFVYLYM